MIGSCWQVISCNRLVSKSIQLSFCIKRSRTYIRHFGFKLRCGIPEIALIYMSGRGTEVLPHMAHADWPIEIIMSHKGMALIDQ